MWAVALAVLVPGDREVNERKLEQLAFPATVRRFEDQDFARRGFVKGFVVPRASMRTSRSTPIHPCAAAAIGSPVRPGRSSRHRRRTWSAISAWMPTRISSSSAKATRCPVDGGQLNIGRSIVVGHIYQLGKKYSEPLEATFTEEDGSRAGLLDGGLRHRHLPDPGGGGRVIPRLRRADAAEVLAPFEAAAILANHDDEQAIAEAERIYGDLTARASAWPWTIAMSAAGREVRRRRPDRLSGPGHGGQARHRHRHGGPEAPVHGGAQQRTLAEAAEAAVALLATAP